MSKVELSGLTTRSPVTLSSWPVSMLSSRCINTVSAISMRSAASYLCFSGCIVPVVSLEYELSPTSPVHLAWHCRLWSSNHPEHPDSPSRPHRCAGRGPHASLLRSGAEDRRVPGSLFAHSGVQVWIFMNVLFLVVHLDSRKHMDSAVTSLCAGGPSDMYTMSALPLPPTNMRLERVGTRGSRCNRPVFSFSNVQKMAVHCIHRVTCYVQCTNSKCIMFMQYHSLGLLSLIISHSIHFIIQAITQPTPSQPPYSKPPHSSPQAPHPRWPPWDLPNINTKTPPQVKTHQVPTKSPRPRSCLDGSTHLQGPTHTLSPHIQSIEATHRE
ncbi:hypothetical protein RSAG8_05706, partial [Rhizoctonia solani AG-8 WAC10335]